MAAESIIELHEVRKSFRAADGTARPVLEGVEFTLREGEIVALLGRSGASRAAPSGGCERMRAGVEIGRAHV